MASDLPKPLIAAEINLHGLHYMPLDVERLLTSTFDGLCSDAEWRAGVTAWCRAWKQVPAGSLPNNDALLARLLGYGKDVRSWKEVRANALHGFILCDDGRLYHPVVCELAEKAWKQREKWRRKKAKQRGSDGQDEAVDTDEDAGGDNGDPSSTGQGDTSPGQSTEQPPAMSPPASTTLSPGTGEGTDGDRSEGTPPGILPCREVVGKKDRKDSHQRPVPSSASRGPDPAVDVDDDVARIEAIARKVIEITGADASRNAKWHFLKKSVADWLHRGADPDLDIYPAARSSVAQLGGPPNSPAYIGKILLEAIQGRQDEGATGRRPAKPKPNYGGVIPLPERIQTDHPFDRAFEAWTASGRKGPGPRLEDYTAQGNA